jgi:hypothetical protein
MMCIRRRPPRRYQWHEMLRLHQSGWENAPPLSRGPDKLPVKGRFPWGEAADRIRMDGPLVWSRTGVDTGPH